MNDTVVPNDGIDIGKARSQSDCSPEILVLLSGGVDSAACVSLYSELGRPACGLFVDYGQPSAKPEKVSALAVSKHYTVPLMEAEWRGPSLKKAGLIPGRNGFLVLAALMECPLNVTGIAIGIHPGTEYPDCSQQFVSMIQDVADAYTDGKVEVLAPFVEWQKADIYEYCRSKDVPVHLTYSCESGGPPPCGKCLSCKDRELLDAGA